MQLVLKYELKVVMHQMEYVIRCIWDEEACVWIAHNDYIPLTMESDSLDYLMKKVRDAIPELIELNHIEKPKFLYFLADRNFL